MSKGPKLIIESLSGSKNGLVIQDAHVHRIYSKLTGEELHSYSHLGQYVTAITAKDQSDGKFMQYYDFKGSSGNSANVNGFLLQKIKYIPTDSTASWYFYTGNGGFFPFAKMTELGDFITHANTDQTITLTDNASFGLLYVHFNKFIGNSNFTFNDNSSSIQCFHAFLSVEDFYGKKVSKNSETTFVLELKKFYYIKARTWPNSTASTINSSRTAEFIFCCSQPNSNTISCGENYNNAFSITYNQSTKNIIITLPSEAYGGIDLEIYELPLYIENVNVSGKRESQPLVEATSCTVAANTLTWNFPVLNDSSVFPTYFTIDFKGKHFYRESSYERTKTYIIDVGGLSLNKTYQGKWNCWSSDGTGLPWYTTGKFSFTLTRQGNNIIVTSTDLPNTYSNGISSQSCMMDSYKITTTNYYE